MHDRLDKLDQRIHEECVRHGLTYPRPPEPPPKEMPDYLYTAL